MSNPADAAYMERARELKKETMQAIAKLCKMFQEKQTNVDPELDVIHATVTKLFDYVDDKCTGITQEQVDTRLLETIYLCEDAYEILEIIPMYYETRINGHRELGWGTPCLPGSSAYSSLKKVASTVKWYETSRKGRSERLAGLKTIKGHFEKIGICPKGILEPVPPWKNGLNKNIHR